MMGRQSRQMALLFVDIESLIPENHLLRKIDRMVSFDFIYDFLAPYYSETGRPSTVNPFTDVAADAYYANAVLWAAENGITGGTTANTFSPNNDCTRAQIVTFLFRCLGEE